MTFREKCLRCVMIYELKIFLNRWNFCTFFAQWNVHPCEKVIGIFFRIEFDRDHCILVDCVWYVLKDPLKEIKSVKYLSGVISMSRVMKHWKQARCQFCDVKFGHRIMEAVDLFDYRMRIANQITFNFTNRRRKGVVPRFVDFVLHKWYSRKLYIIK